MGAVGRGAGAGREDGRILRPERNISLICTENMLIFTQMLMQAKKITAERIDGPKTGKVKGNEGSCKFIIA